MIQCVLTVIGVIATIFGILMFCVPWHSEYIKELGEKR
jgi:hypothetical protein